MNDAAFGNIIQEMINWGRAHRNVVTKEATEI